MEPICISSQKPGWWSLTEADKHRWGGKKQWAELCWKRIIQKTHRIPLLINTPLSVEGPTRDKLGMVAFLMTLVTHRRRSAEVQRCVILALWVCFFFPELCFFFLWDFGFVLFCFFRVVAVHLLVTSEGADRFHFPELTTEPLKWRACSWQRTFWTFHLQQSITAVVHPHWLSVILLEWLILVYVNSIGQPFECFAIDFFSQTAALTRSRFFFIL